MSSILIFTGCNCFSGNFSYCLGEIYNSAVWNVLFGINSLIVLSSVWNELSDRIKPYLERIL